MKIKNLKLSVYRNLNQNCYSVKPSTGKVFHVSAIALTDVEFSVNKSGREKVLKTGVKNVHAFIKGRIAPCMNCYHFPKFDIPDLSEMEEISYNPFLSNNFCKETGEPVTRAYYTLVCDQGIFAYLAI